MKFYMVKKPDKSNYSNDGESSSPFKKGRLQDIVKPKRLRHTRFVGKSDRDVANELTIDLVQVFADVGICLHNVHTIARGLVRLGWVKLKKLEG